MTEKSGVVVCGWWLTEDNEKSQGKIAVMDFHGLVTESVCLLFSWCSHAINH
jgi:hypothetical protein